MKVPTPLDVLPSGFRGKRCVPFSSRANFDVYASLPLLFFLLLIPGNGHVVSAAKISKIPIPSPPQFRYQSTDFVALIHFNMATFAHNGDPGCDETNWNIKAEYATGQTSDPATFNPRLLNITQWFDSILELGANIAVLTAKHGCGFCLWPTNSTYDDGRPYGYHTTRDIIQEFVEAANAAGVGYGFYYSLLKSFKLCRSFSGTNSCTTKVLDGQYNASDDEYSRIVKQQVTELWTQYGEMTEVWIDSKRTDELEKLMVQLQPNAEGTPAHPRGWCGTESGYPSRDVGDGPIWQTGEGFMGDANSPNWVDKFCDPQLFVDHIWFWQPDLAVRSLEDMIPIYHDIVGRGMVMELAFSIDRDGLVEASHAKTYKELGGWVRSCYGGQSAAASVTNIQGTVLEVNIPARTEFDRFMIQEDIAMGQRIRNYTVTIDGGDGHEIKLVSNGTSVGRKRIHIFDKIYLSAEPTLLTLNITQSIAMPHISLVGLFGPCYPRHPRGGGAKQEKEDIEDLTPTVVLLQQ